MNNWEEYLKLDKTPDGSLSNIVLKDEIKEVHHTDLIHVFTIWKNKLAKGGKLSFTLLDLTWLAEQIKRFEKGQLLTGYYCDFDGERGLQNLLFGDKDIKYGSGFTKRSLYEWLDGMQMRKIKIEEIIIGDTGYLKASCIK